MLCPRCAAYAIPQARRLHQLARDTDLVVLGLHTVFEYHAAMTPVALDAYLHEYRGAFPVGADGASEDGPIPQTMVAYSLRSTPSTAAGQPWEKALQTPHRGQYHNFP